MSASSLLPAQLSQQSSLYWKSLLPEFAHGRSARHLTIVIGILSNQTNSIAKMYTAILAEEEYFNAMK